MAEFEPAFHKTNGTEGGVNYNPHDQGNVVVNGVCTVPTYRGIAPVFNPRWEGFRFVTGAAAQMTAMPIYGTGAYRNWAAYLNGQLAKLIALQTLVKTFYNSSIWDANRLGEINDQTVAEWIYDHIVNAGTRGKLWAQLAARVAPDGKIGSATITALNGSKPEELLQRLEDIAGEFRLDRCHDRPGQIPNLTSWLTRDGQPPEIVALVRKAAADGTLDDREVAALKAAMEATA